MNDIYLVGGVAIVFAIISIISWADYLIMLWKTRKNSLVVFYIGQDNSIQIAPVKVGTDKSDLEISIGKRSFIFDPERVYKMPNLGLYKNKKCLFVTYKDCKPIDFHNIGGKQDKTPVELYAMLRTKMFQEIMAGNNDLLSKSLPIFVIIIIVLAGYFGAKTMGWI